MTVASSVGSPPPVKHLKLAGLLMLWLPAFTLFAHPELELTLAPSEVPLIITEDTLQAVGTEPAWSSAVAIARPPIHGTLTSTVNGFEYSPNPDFWTLGSDTFSYRGLDSSGQPIYRRAVIYSAHHGIRFDYLSFEQAPDGLAVSSEISHKRSADAAMSGEWGLHVTGFNGSTAPLYGSGPSQGGGGPDSGGDCLRLIPPPFESALSLDPPLHLIEIGSFGSSPAFVVKAHQFNPMKLSAEARSAMGQILSTPMVEVPDTGGARMIQLDWWKAGAGRSSGGLMLLVDGDHVAEISHSSLKAEIDNVGVDTFHQQLVRYPGTEDLELYLDDLEIRTRYGIGDGPPAAFSPVLSHSFQGLDLSDWANGLETTASLTPATDFEGNQRLSVDLGVAYPRFVVDNSPQALAGYNVRFRTDLNELSMAEGEDLLIFAASAAENAAIPEIHVQLWLRFENGGFVVFVRQKNAGVPRIDSPPVSLGNSSPVIEIQWQAATRNDVANGKLRLWIDGVAEAELVGLANGDHRIESVRLGAKNVDPGTSGRLYFDDLDSWSSAPIPESP